MNGLIVGVRRGSANGALWLLAALLWIGDGSALRGQEVGSKARIERLELLLKRIEALERENAELRARLEKVVGPAEGRAAAAPVPQPSSVPVPGVGGQVVQSTGSAQESPLPVATTPVMDAAEVAKLPPVTPETRVGVGELIAQFQANPSVAEGRFRRRRFEVEGVISAVEKELFQAPYRVVFYADKGPWTLVCEVLPPDKFKKVYASADRKRVVGESFGARTILAEVGRSVRLRGRCVGVKGTAIRLESVEVIGNDGAAK